MQLYMRKLNDRICCFLHAIKLACSCILEKQRIANQPAMRQVFASHVTRTIASWNWASDHKKRRYSFDQYKQMSLTQVSILGRGVPRPNKSLEQGSWVCREKRVKGCGYPNAHRRWAVTRRVITTHLWAFIFSRIFRGVIPSPLWHASATPSLHLL